MQKAQRIARSIRFAMHVSLILGLPLANAETPNSQILWSVQNRFRLFDYLVNQDPEQSARLLERYSASGTLSNPSALADYSVVTSSGSPFIPRTNRSINPGPWDPSKQEYTKEYARDNREKHRVAFSLSSPLDGACKWLIDGQLPKEVPCRDSLIVDDVPSAFKVEVELSGGARIWLRDQIRERKIVAIGDSYGSGEGNPDAPTVWKKDASFDGHRMARSLRNMEEQALWWDQRCHRSFWSNQMFAALSFSLADTHSVVTFLSYSCSGAEIYDGLLMPQREPPGREKYLEQASCNDSREKCPDERYSQLSAAARDLCPSQYVTLDVTTPGKPWTEYKGVAVSGRACETTSNIDTLLISIGGNDVGFSHVVAWGLMPASTRNRNVLLKSGLVIARRTNAACPSADAARMQKTFGVCDPPPAEHLARNDLPKLYDSFAKALDAQLRLPTSSRIFITAYPNPLQDANGNDCDGMQRSDWRKNGQVNVQAGWDAIAYFVNHSVSFLDARNWEFNLTKGEEIQVRGPVISTLNNTLSVKARSYGWKVVDEHLTHYLSHGWCAIGPQESIADFVMPGIPRGGIEGVQPWLWRAYKPRGRWLRTINDALLTQWTSHFEGASAGSFHPTAEGHYATGKAIFTQSGKNVETTVARASPNGT